MSEDPRRVHLLDLKAVDTQRCAQAAQLLYEGFQEHWPDAWPTLQAARDEIAECTTDDRICRGAVCAGTGELLGFVGAISSYRGRVWEVHPLVVATPWRGQGIGRLLVADLEVQVAARGGITLWVGSDDEAGMTSLGGVDLYPDPLEHLRRIRNLSRHPFEFYCKLGFVPTGVLPDANGFGKPDIFLAKRIGQRQRR